MKDATISWKVQVGLLVVLLCFGYSSDSHSVALVVGGDTAVLAPSEEVVLAPAPELAPVEEPVLAEPETITSPNLIDNTQWNGATYGNDPGGCCTSISGSGALYDNSTDTIMFSYGSDLLSQTIAINQALQATGIQVDGYQYGWTYKMVSNSGNMGSETLIFTVEVKDADGNLVETYQYDRSWGAGPYDFVRSKDTWYTDSGTETFASPHMDPQSITLKILGKDGGFWGGYYGPEVKDVSLQLIYSVNPCAADPLYDPSCSGYAEALAQQLYDQNCAANPLYDAGCPGYQQAYYDQQCTANPLYDAGCPNYAQAYYDQQCSLDPLYDMGCTGYEQAYYDQQCGIDPLYDSGCSGYAQAYLDQQCGIDPLYDSTCAGYAQAYYDQQCSLDALYDNQCPGYAEAYAQEYILNDSTASTTETVSTTSETVTASTNIEDIGMPSATGDSTVDEILGDLNEVPTTTLVMESSTVEAMPSVSETQETEAETETTAEADSAGEMEELASVETETESSDESGTTEDAGGDDTESSNESEGETADGGDQKSEKKDSKREKMKKAIAKRASKLAEQMGNAASLEAQKAAQATVLALINYVPDFNTYSRMMNGGYLPDANGYPDSNVPESRRGLRNGLAQQLLHEKMVEMQYENLSNQ